MYMYAMFAVTERVVFECILRKAVNKPVLYFPYKICSAF